MAETVTRQLREPFVEAAGLGITNEGLRLLKDKILTEKNLQEIIRQSTRGEGEWGSIFRTKVEEKVKGVKIV